MVLNEVEKSENLLFSWILKLSTIEGVEVLDAVLVLSFY